jgi:hypothetical protein
MEQGAGAYTLCYTCNSEISGNHYVAELKRWTAIGMSAISRGFASGGEGNAVELRIDRAHPARLLKQIVVMLASVNSTALLEHHRALREYAMNPHATGLLPRYQFYLLVTHPQSKVSRYAGLSLRLASGTWCGTWVTDLVWPPFGYLMTIDEAQPLLPIGNITSFANYAYDERVDLTLQLPILVGEHPYPGEYGDPVGNGAFASRQAEVFPTAESVRIPVTSTECLIPDGPVKLTAHVRRATAGQRIICASFSPLGIRESSGLCSELVTREADRRWQIGDEACDRRTARFACRVAAT